MNLKKKNNDIVLEEVWCENGAGSTLPLLKYPLLEQTGIVEHCFTTRIGGVSKGIYESLNLSFTRGDEDAAVRENFRRLAGAIKTDVSRSDTHDKCAQGDGGGCRKRDCKREGLYGY